MPAPPGEVSRLLAELKLGKKEALGSLIPLVYEELRRLAGHYLRCERPGHTLQPTALVHEAYLRLAGQDRADWQNRGQFLAVAAQLMRRILVDYARGRAAGKRGGHAGPAEMEEIGRGSGDPQIEEILAVDRALSRLEALDPQQARVVELRYFAGMTVRETAGEMGLSERTIKREWAMASAWLSGQLAGWNLR